MKEILPTKKEKINKLIQQLSNEYVRCFECRHMVHKIKENLYSYNNKPIYLCNSCSYHF